MSELEWNWAYAPYLDPPEKQKESALNAGYVKVVSKDEADKVIAELEMKLAAAQLVQRLNKPEALYSNLETMSRLSHKIHIVERRECHHKYKRCLAMARWCRMHDEFTQLESERLGLQQRTLFFEYRKKAMWWNKWCKRWLELAEKFKEAE